MTVQSSKECEIILASHALFKRFGFSKTTMEDIGNEVGLNQASLYHYFRGGKEEIFLKVIVNQFSELRDSIRTALEDVIGLQQKLVVSYIAKFDFLRADPLLNQVFDLDSRKISPESKKQIRDVLLLERELIASIFQEAIENKEIPKIDPQKAAQVIVYLTQGIRFTQLKKRILEGKDQTKKEIRNELELAISLLINGIKHPR